MQLKEETRQPHQTKNVPSGPALPSLAHEENDDSDGADETAMSSEPASKNGVQRDAIDDQLADFMKEIDAISTPVPGTEESCEQSSEPTEKEPVATTSGSAPVSKAAPQKASSQELVTLGSIVAVPPPPPPPAEGEVPPCPWVECIDESTGYTYFWNQVTNEVTWDCPPEYEAYWAQYGEPLEGSAVDHNAGAASHDGTPATAATAEPTPSSASTSKPGAGGTAVVDVDSVAASTGHIKMAKPTKTEQPGASVGSSSTSKLAASAKKKRKQETVIGAIIPITSYGASDSSSSEDSDYERRIVQRASSKKHPAKRSKASSSAKQAKRGSSPVVVYGPQLPDSSLNQPEPLVYGPQLPAALDSAEPVVYGPQLPSDTSSTEEMVYGPHLPNAVDLEPEPEPTVMIGPQLPESEDTASEAAISSKVFIGPQLPEGFLENKVEPCGEKVCESSSSLEPVVCSQEPTEVDERKPEPETAIANQCVAATHESESPPKVEKEHTTSKGSEPEATVLASALAGLVDYPGSPVADSGDDDGMDVQKEVAEVKAPSNDQASVNYPVMTDGKLQFESAAQGPSDVDGPKDAALSSPEAKGSAVVSQAPASSPARSVQSKAKHSTHTKKKSQHLVSYGDSESSDEDSVEVDVTAESPAAAATHERSDPALAAASETEDDSRHPGLGSSRKAPSEDGECASKPPSKKLPFVKVNFVRSAEVLVLSECVDVGAEPKKETKEESEKETEMETEEETRKESGEEGVRVSPGSDNKTAGTREGSASPAERKASEDSDMDDFDDVVRALDIALLESQKKKAQEDVTKPTASPKTETETSQPPCDTSEEEGEIRSSESSSEDDAPPAKLRKSSTKEETEAREEKVPPKRKRASRSKTPSPTPDRKAEEVRVKIGDAYQLLMEKLNPLRDVVSCRNAYFELVVQTTTRMEDWRAGVLEAGYFLQKLLAACDAATQLHQQVAKAQEEASRSPEESGQGPLPPGWQRHWDRYGVCRLSFFATSSVYCVGTLPSPTRRRRKKKRKESWYVKGSKMREIKSAGEMLPESGLRCQSEGRCGERTTLLFFCSLSATQTVGGSQSVVAFITFPA